jgi:aromatic ring-opening dioxygenase catalytic subunit (LigB family)
MTESVRMPSLFIPHGGGPAFFMTGGMHDMFAPMQQFLSGLRATLPATPSAILVVTAHWEAPVPTLSGSPSPELIYDYYGFPPETYTLGYAAPAASALAGQAAAALQAAGIRAQVDPAHGWDHGVFIPLKVMFPDADVPVLAMSLQSDLDPKAHVAIGEALRPLRDQGVLILGSGMSYHNLGNFRTGAGGSDAQAFDNWLDTALEGDSKHRAQALARWADAPGGRASHPREEHLLPLMVASGAGSDLPAQKIWSGLVGTTRTSAWSFA